MDKDILKELIQLYIEKVGGIEKVRELRNTLFQVCQSSGDETRDFVARAGIETTESYMLITTALLGVSIANYLWAIEHLHKAP